ncbi:MAG: DUF2490 domain-containing protein [Candidatus Omnitrophica bacterium]|nr:DUF2490 domain-containing protein [Candidatus Omnitrophota bacterium]
MFRFCIITLVVFPILTFLFSGSSFAFDADDLQYWNTESASYKINKDWKIKAEEELRFSEHARGLYYEHTDLGLTYSGLAKWFDVGVNYRLIYEDKGEKRKHENRPHINATLKYSPGNLNLSNRSRMEFRNKQDSDDAWRYRNKSIAKFSYNLMKNLKASPYIANESFLDFDEEEYSRNRLYSGVDFKIFKNFGIDVYYLWEANYIESKDSWKSYNIIGTKAKLSF